ncbi:MAG: glycerate kinase [Atopostipes suicloacalis]|nr:glycerate kinase [Atopostipes suicloacalis]
MKILSAIDSFKGSMTSKEANLAVKEALPEHSVDCFSVADGGEGTVEAFVTALKGEYIKGEIIGVNGEPYESYWGWIEDEKTAVIEVAEAAGLIHANKETLHPKNHTSYGVGQQVLAAMDYGAERIILGLGGSATIDGGMGLLQALGFLFKDAKNEDLPILPITLDQINSIDQSAVDPRLEKVDWTIASDVNNPLIGENGAVFVFGEQKGLSEEELLVYDKKMSHYAKLVNKSSQKDKRKIPGAGAAGGIGFAILSFFEANLVGGLNLLAEMGNLEATIKAADLIITGEGKFDDQSLTGKVPISISRLAKKHQRPVILFAGQIDSNRMAIPEENIQALIPIVNRVLTLDDSMRQGKELLKEAVKRTFHLLSISHQFPKDKEKT